MKTHTIEHLIDKIQNADNLTKVDRRELSNLLKSQQKASTFYALVHELTEIGEQEMSGDDWKGIFQNCFNKIGEGISADRIRYYDYTIQPDTGEPGLRSEAEWLSKSGREFLGPEDRSVFIPRKKFNKLYKKFDQSSPYQTQISDQEMGPLKMFMQANKCRSTLILPIRNSTTLYGVIWVDNCYEDREWASSELTLLRPLIFQFRNLLEKRDLEKQLRHMYRQARIGTWEMNLESESFSWSPVTKEIFEVDQDREPDNQLAMEILYDDETKRELMQVVERAKITGEPYDMVLKIKTTGGEMKWVRDTGQAQFKNGKCVRLYGIVQDIHNRKLAEQESEKNKRLLEAITQQTEVAVWV